jgi:hypothetical protein
MTADSEIDGDFPEVEPMGFWKALAIFLGIPLGVALGLFLLVVQPGPSGVVASLRLADGSEYMVTQRCNWSAEPYTVEFFMRSPGGRWGWCYIDHQADRWQRVAMTYDAKADAIVVTQRGVRRAVLDRTKGTFWSDNGRAPRNMPAPQAFSEPAFAFP